MNVIYIHMETAMNSAARLPYFHPAPWMVIGAVIGVAMIGLHSIGHIVILLLALGFAAKWACRWHAANTANNGPQTTIWPSCGFGSGWGWGRWREMRPTSNNGGGGGAPGEPPTSGNSAFDDYRREMLHRLEQDHQDFKSFLDRLRRAKDKAEFDQFMSERDLRGTPTTEPPHNPWPTA